MKNENLAAVAFGTVLCVVAFIYVLDAIGACDSKASSMSIAHGDASSCFDYWLNRYQLLLGGCFTLLGAVIAGCFVYLQIKETRLQTGIMLGDITPDFILIAPPLIPRERVPDFTLTAINQNRRPIELISFKVVSHPDILAHPHWTEGLKIIGEKGRVTKISAYIGGTRPQAAEANSLTINGDFAVANAPSVQSVEDLVLTIGYRISGTPGQKTVERTLHSARVSHRVTTSPGGGQFTERTRRR